MAMNNTWFSWFWSMWTDNCDVLLPAYERANVVLAKNGWKSALNEPCMRQVAEFWWDAINVHKISPRGMPSYDRNEANAVFMAGGAAFPLGDSAYLGTFNHPAQSQVGRQDNIAHLPPRPTSQGHMALEHTWGRGHPPTLP